MRLQLPSNNSQAYKTIITISEILLIWLVIIAEVFTFNKFTGNEYDILPFARQVYNSSWLPNDWYLNLVIGYRGVSNYFFGFLVDWLGFLNGGYAGRLISYLLLAIALFIFFRTIRLRFSLGLIVLLLFLGNQTLIAGEWIAGGADTKTLAYAFALLTFSFFFQKKYLIGFAFAGAALSFHVLIGTYALFCTLVALFLTSDSWRRDFRTLIRQSWPFFFSGIFGILAIVQQLIPQGAIGVNRAWKFYVEIRVPHHVLPSAWNGEFWIVELVFATCFFTAIYLFIKTGPFKFTAAYALGSVFLFGIGLVLYANGQTTLLRFYWFRYPDVMVPFLSAVLVALLLNYLTYLNIADIPRIKSNFKWTQSIFSKGLPLLFALIAVLLSLQSLRFLQVKYQRGKLRQNPDSRVVFEWIEENTDKDAVFLIDPLILDFYLYAQRALFVSFQHSPQSAADILEWYERIELSNGDQSFLTPKAKGNLRENFYQLDPLSIQRLADTYGLTYYLGLAENQLLFERVYTDDTFVLYKIDQASDG